jgi:hypothetical protein
MFKPKTRKRSPKSAKTKSMVIREAARNIAKLRRSDLFIERPPPWSSFLFFSGADCGGEWLCRADGRQTRSLAGIVSAPLKNKKEIVDGRAFYKQVIPNGI